MPPCPECSSAHTYGMGSLLVRPECAHEWQLKSGVVRKV
ncbi:hypothetical protein ACFWUZ_01755 [Streptomyces sp. NPDC058646]